ncbi:divalent-cation tolerance protein CutA [Haloechinothrix sp. LS1_15]|uniref:divalent-cation tolerance protein CutA n=1 Tax=Haloechinothrix sp. LS1_15 TaxID=2652248 RepID=UPI002947C873|nr:divalent-cation tolerance protein CutA [Haloechinothrix sp. LS1_15]MDV6012535.1 divalent-cation tolerance protein CutA [Haloechinothrix sp. LS1_15]
MTSEQHAAQHAEHVIVSSTTDSEGEAKRLAADAIDAKLGACAQVVGPITSVYRWEGKVCHDTEWRVDIKTAADRVSALAEHLSERHSYDVPEIVATPITGGSAEYLSWVVAESRGQ